MTAREILNAIRSGLEQTRSDYQSGRITKNGLTVRLVDGTCFLVTTPLILDLPEGDDEDDEPDQDDDDDFEDDEFDDEDDDEVDS